MDVKDKEKERPYFQADDTGSKFGGLSSENTEKQSAWLIDEVSKNSWLSRGVDVPHVKIAGTVRFREKAVMDWLIEKERERKRRNFEA